ncbi:MAG: ketoacyl-ACP synthase III [Coriobacteriia bacterium]|nr:ketoacyl-ACP synthase III [Coriobacteriia bacterium]
MSLRIVSLGKGIPAHRVSNDDLAAFIDTSDEWIRTRTGIESRYVCRDESLTDLATAAATEAIERAGLAPSDIDLVIGSTFEGDYLTPSLSCCVAERLGTQCPAFDLNAACTGFIFALEVAAGFVERQKAKRVLIVCAEMMSKHIDWHDRSTCVLFGDGSAAVIVEPGEALKYISISTSPNSEMLSLPVGTGNSPFVHHGKTKGFLAMEGQKVFKFAVNVGAVELSKAMSALGMTPEEIDYFVLHQANKRIIDSIRAKVGQPEEKFPMNIQRYGNISSVAIPLLLLEMWESDKLKSGDVLFLSAFGAGMTAGSCVIVWG